MNDAMRLILKEMDGRIMRLAAGCATLAKVIDEQEKRLKALEDLAAGPEVKT